MRTTYTECNLRDLVLSKATPPFEGLSLENRRVCSNRVTVDVVFDTPQNYRFEELLFHIVPFHSGYHALLGEMYLQDSMQYLITGI